MGALSLFLQAPLKLTLLMVWLMGISGRSSLPPSFFAPPPPSYSPTDPTGCWGASMGMVLSTEAERREPGGPGMEAGAEVGVGHRG